jgi:hypothetical protein
MSHHEPKSTSTRGVMRLFIESDDASSARGIGLSLSNELPPTLHPVITSVKKYWKIPAWFEVIVKFGNNATIEEMLASVQFLSTKWKVQISETDGNAMWCPEIGGTFAHPLVRWVNIECFHHS